MDRVLPTAVTAVPTPTETDAKRALTALAVRAHGIGTVADIADYYRLPVAETRLALTELAEDGEVTAVQVDGWTDTGYLHRDARIPRAVTGTALLCPFDPLIWRRARTERLFDFHYRIEIYTPRAEAPIRLLRVPVARRRRPRGSLRPQGGPCRLPIAGAGVLARTRCGRHRRRRTPRRSNWRGWRGGWGSPRLS